MMDGSALRPLLGAHGNGGRLHARLAIFIALVLSASAATDLLAEPLNATTSTATTVLSQEYEPEAHAGKRYLYVYLHIAKTGGTTFNSYFSRIFHREANVQDEGTWNYWHRHPRTWIQRHQGGLDPEALENKLERRVVVLLRSPRSHMRSMYAQCDLECPGWQKPTFREWLTANYDLFRTNEYLPKWGMADQSTWERGPFGCWYVAVNYQWGRMNAMPLDRVWALGLTEHFRESLCLFLYQYNGTISEHCPCDGADVVVRNKKPSDFALAPEEERMIHEMTALDQLLYDRARAVFITRIKRLEQKTGFDIFCRPDPLYPSPATDAGAAPAGAERP